MEQYVTDWESGTKRLSHSVHGVHDRRTEASWRSGQTGADDSLKSISSDILLPMRTQLQITTSDVDRVTLARDIGFFTVAFSTTKRGAELTATLIQRILRLPNKSGLMFNFQYGKTQRDGADHILTVPYDE